MVNLSDTVSLDPSLIEKAVFIKAGSKISAKLATLGSGIVEDLVTPEDELLVHSKDQSVVAVRGEEAKNAWETLKKLQTEEKLSFTMTGGE